MKKYIYLFTLIFFASLTQAQDIPFDKKLFKERKDDFKAAKKNVKISSILGVFGPKIDVFWTYFSSCYGSNSKEKKGKWLKIEYMTGMYVFYPYNQFRTKQNKVALLEFKIPLFVVRK